MNGRHLSSLQQQEMRDILLQSSKDSHLDIQKKLSLRDMFTHKLRRRTFILMFCWICGIVTNYGLLLNVGALSGDIFVNFALARLMDIPAYLVMYLIVDALGK